ncbi:HTH domain-containing protein [Runella zeae]|uniref:HTH domain-containing protein n=1 Tax=Runella zeae TaxID=94255 RepID=UPI0004183D11|nr:HTH domain-containing protein [Runella zeae]
MPLLKNIEKYKQLHSLIKKQATGNAKELAYKMGITERQVYNYIQELRDLDIPIRYDTIHSTYYYEKPVHFEFFFGVLPLTGSELSKTEGGTLCFWEDAKIITSLKFYFSD